MSDDQSPSEPDAVRPWGYYWVTTEEDDDGDEATLAEWRCSDARRNEGCWWFCGSGAYDDDPPRVKSVVMGPLVPPRPRPPWMANHGCPGCGSSSEWCLDLCPLISMSDDQRRRAYALRDLTVPPTGRIIPE